MEFSFVTFFDTQNRKTAYPMFICSNGILPVIHNQVVSVKCNIWNFHLWHFSIREIEKTAQMWLFTYSSHVYLFKWNPIVISALHRTCLSSIIRWFLLNVTFGIFICNIFRYAKSKNGSNVVIYVFIPCLSVQMESYCHLCIA